METRIFVRRELLFLFLEIGIDDIVILSVCARISALGTRLLALLRQNPFPTSAWQMPPSRYEQALARGLSGKKPR